MREGMEGRGWGGVGWGGGEREGCGRQWALVGVAFGGDTSCGCNIGEVGNGCETGLGGGGRCQCDSSVVSKSIVTKKQRQNNSVLLKHCHVSRNLKETEYNEDERQSFFQFTRPPVYNDEQSPMYNDEQSRPSTPITLLSPHFSLAGPADRDREAGTSAFTSCLFVCPASQPPSESRKRVLDVPMNHINVY